MKRHVSILNMASSRGVLLKVLYEHDDRWVTSVEAHKLASERDDYDSEEMTTMGSIVAMSSTHQALDRRGSENGDTDVAEYKINDRGRKIVEMDGILDVGEALDQMS